METTPQFLNEKQVCARWGIGRTALWVRVRDKSAPAPIHFGTSARWALAELEAYEQALAAARGSTGSAV
jgi:predicted DNA-binding transcriptional regulator AlpA